ATDQVWPSQCSTSGLPVSWSRYWPSAHTEDASTAAMPNKSLLSVPTVGTDAIVHADPSQCSTSGTRRFELDPPTAVPAAQASSGARASTASSSCPMADGMIAHRVPSKCTTSGPWLLPSCQCPTAQT